MRATPHQKIIANKISSEIFSDRKTYTDYWDDNREKSVVLFRAEDSPQRGVDTYSTVGLSAYPLLKDEKEIEVRTEIIGACRSNFKNFDNMIATAAFCIINTKWFCAPGVIFPDIVSMYQASSTLSDLYFCPPFLWNDRLSGLTTDEKEIAWLLAVPISKAEAAFVSSFGAAQLEKLFEEADLDIYDANRASVA
ncbi:suppressor of fused domain protein [Oxalobacteraceae bacterium OTU3CAMAD1]|nr:suppressor of fused domain protein [Oxalobacteraceae bacterium OTU3CAMAD1]